MQRCEVEKEDVLLIMLICCDPKGGSCNRLVANLTKNEDGLILHPSRELRRLVGPLSSRGLSSNDLVSTAFTEDLCSLTGQPTAVNGEENCQLTFLVFIRKDNIVIP
jgi:hypothetical protein